MRRLIFTLFILVLIIWSDRHSNGQQSNAPGQVTSVAPLRRVVTGTNAEGKSTVIFDGPAPRPDLWITDSTPADNSGNRDAAVGLTPSSPRNLFTWHYWVHPEKNPTPPGVTQSGAPPNSTATLFRVVDFPPGRGVEDPTAGLHYTRTIDYIVIMSGEVDLLMGDGKEVHLKAGDTMVQRAGIHNWINRGKVPCRAAVILIAAKERESYPELKAAR